MSRLTLEDQNLACVAFEHMRLTLSATFCEDVWPDVYSRDDPDRNHFWNKFSRSYGGNFMMFWSGLDRGNREKLFYACTKRHQRDDVILTCTPRLSPLVPSELAGFIGVLTPSASILADEADCLLWCDDHLQNVPSLLGNHNRFIGLRKCTDSTGLQYTWVNLLEDEERKWLLARYNAAHRG